jgi:hypothetical protein
MMIVGSPAGLWLSHDAAVDSSEIADVSITWVGMPHLWPGHSGLDGYSVPLTSFPMTTRSLGDMVGEGGVSKDAEINVIAEGPDPHSRN